MIPLLDFDSMLKRINSDFDEIVAISRLPSVHEMHVRFGAFDDRIIRTKDEVRAVTPESLAPKPGENLRVKLSDYVGKLIESLLIPQCDQGKNCGAQCFDGCDDGLPDGGFGVQSGEWEMAFEAGRSGHIQADQGSTGGFVAAARR